VEAGIGMKFQTYEIPEDLLYTKEHEWARDLGTPVRVGVTDYAAKTLNDVVYVTLPQVNAQVTQFKSIGTVESIKAVSELYSPISGIVAKVNTELELHPELINKSPYSDGWLIEVKGVDFAIDRTRLLNAKQYMDYLETLLKSHN